MVLYVYILIRLRIVFIVVAETIDILAMSPGMPGASSTPNLVKY